MNMVILITLIFTTALVLIPEGVGAGNRLPCQPNYNNNAYNIFVRRHILQASFNTGSKRKWEKYIKNMRLCDRPLQSFIRQKDRKLVVQTCNGSGIRQYLNLCTSTSSMVVYDVRVDTRCCRVKHIAKKRRFVIVACDKVANQCFPVHYQGSVNRPPRKGQRCRVWS